MFKSFLNSNNADKSPNRNHELETLKVRYDGMCKQFKGLQTALKQRHDALLQTAKSRTAVAEAFSALGEETPVSYSAKTNTKVMEEANKKTTEDRSAEYTASVLDYFTLWQNTVTARLNSDIKLTDQLRQDADHYTSKVDNIKGSIKKLEDKNKPVPSDMSYKLERNEQKHQEAVNAYTRSSKQLIMLLDELVDRSWRDMHPLLVKIIQFDLNHHEGEKELLLNDLQRSVDDLKQLQEENQIPDDGRLKDIEKEKPKDLATGPIKSRREPQPYSSNVPQKEDLSRSPKKHDDNDNEKSPKKEKKKKKKNKDKENDRNRAKDPEEKNETVPMPDAPPPVYNSDGEQDPESSSPQRCDASPWEKPPDDDDMSSEGDKARSTSLLPNNDKGTFDREPQPYGSKEVSDSPSSSISGDDDDDYAARNVDSSADREPQPYSYGQSQSDNDDSDLEENGDREPQPYSHDQSGNDDYSEDEDNDDPPASDYKSNNVFNNDDDGSRSGAGGDSVEDGGTPPYVSTVDDSSEEGDDYRESNNAGSDNDSEDNHDNDDYESNNVGNNSNEFDADSDNKEVPYDENGNAGNGRMPWRPPRAAGKGTKRKPEGEEGPGKTSEEDYANADPEKWKVKKQSFSGGYAYVTLGETEEQLGSIKKGKKEFKANPQKYVAMVYQTDMVDWPHEHQRYNYIHREGTKGFVPTGVSEGGHMTVLTQAYERIPRMPDNELPEEFRDDWTDHMTHQGRKLHSENNKPILPGRGMGIGDTPDLKIIGDVDPSDIHQGAVGNCWLLSGISALAEFDGAIKHLYRKTTRLDERPLLEPNQYTITLWDLETWTEKDYVIDERLAAKSDGSGQLLGTTPSEDGELWVCYLEKALAIHCGGWDKITGGQCTHAWALMTGCKHQYTIRINKDTGLYACYGKFNPNTKTYSKLCNSPHDGEKNMWPNPWPDVGGGGDFDKELTQEELFMKMCAWDDVNFIIGAACTGKSADAGLVDNHAYSVLECHNDVAGTPIDLIKVRNPWGKGEIENGEFDDDGPGWEKWPQVKDALNPVVADDGIFWVTKDEFFQFFSTIYLSASNMTEFLED